MSEEESKDKTIINCGYITADKQVLSKFESELRKMLPFSQFYLYENNGSFCREQALINLGLIRSKSYELLADRFNYQLLYSEPNGSEVTHLNAKESKQKYRHLIDNWLDEKYKDLKTSDLDRELKNKTKVLNWSNENIGCALKLDINDYISAKKLIDKEFDLVIVDLRKDLSNLKITLHLVKKHIERGKVIGFISNHEYKTLERIKCDYEIVGEYGHLTIVHIKN